MIQLELDLTWMQKLHDMGMETFSYRTIAEIALLHGVSQVAVPIEWQGFSEGKMVSQTNQIFSEADSENLLNHPNLNRKITICTKNGDMYSPSNFERTDDVQFTIEALLDKNVQLFIRPEKSQVKTAYDLGASGVVVDAKGFLMAETHHDKMVALEVLSNLAMQAYRYDMNVTLWGDFNIIDCRYLRDLEQFDFVSIGKSFFNRSLLLGLEKTIQEFTKVL